MVQILCPWKKLQTDGIPRNGETDESTGESSFSDEKTDLKLQLIRKRKVKEERRKEGKIKKERNYGREKRKGLVSAGIWRTETDE